MNDLIGKWCAVGLVVFVLSGCAPGGTADSPASAGAIEVAVTKTCVAGSSPDCVAVNGEHVLVTDGAFQKVELKAITAADSQPGNAVDLELTQDGAAVLTASTTSASEAGEDARLVIKVGDNMLSAVTVVEPLRDDHVTISLPDDITVEEFAAESRRS